MQTKLATEKLIKTGFFNRKQKSVLEKILGCSIDGCAQWTLFVNEATIHALESIQ